MSKEIIIRPNDEWKLIDFREIWNYRELLYIFVWRDIKSRYKQTVLGVLWVILQPLITMIIFTIFFGSLAKIQSGNLPYSLFVFCGLIFWTFFSSALSHASDSLVVNESIIKKAYFPRIILPLSSVLTGLLDFLINMVILIFYALILGYVPNYTIVYILPFAVLLTLITSLGLGLFLTSLNVKYRDVRYILPFFIQLLMFITPIIYPLSIVSERNRIIMAINPLASVVEMVRYSFSSTYLVQIGLTIISFLTSLLILAAGLVYFKKTEKFIADIV